MMIWVIILEKIATLEEIERSWSLDDVLRANALLQYRQAVQNDHSRQIQMKSHKKSGK